jgi:glutamate N-acetyltransferase/amino-acid N-acetyltransferase
MKTPFQEIAGGITAPAGFLAAGVFCDIKRLGTGKGSDKGRKRDLALIVSEVPAAAAGLFTTNQVCAAPVKVSQEHLRGGLAQAIVVNSGNANACTGDRGRRDAREMTRLVAQALRMPASQVLVGSTGRIGLPLPMAQVRRGIATAVRLLDTGAPANAAAAEAILTSDTRAKTIAVELELGGRRVRLGGICKGAGMIQPGLSPTGQRPPAMPQHATMLAFLTTDAAVTTEALQIALNEAVARSFNRITVDGDMSTNDSVLLLANGLAENRPIKAGAVRRAFRLSAADSPARRRSDAARFQAALNHVCLSLARMIVRDGEGVHRVVTVRVEGARTMGEADAVARAVANSALVKTSWHGGDPNWGRVLDAVGYSPAHVREDRVAIGYSAPGSRRILWSVRRGQATRVSFRRLCAAVAPAEFELHLRLNLGSGRAVLYAADLTEAYVEFNKGDVADPASLGG